MSNDKSVIPLGFSRNEGGGASLHPVNGERECVECDDGIITPPSSTGGWGIPDSPKTVICRNCGAKYTLGLVLDD